MTRAPASLLRRIASTLLVLAALFVVCAGVQAMPCASQDDAVTTLVAAVSPDDASEPGEQDTVPSLEDNNGGLDDTFDVPGEHGVAVSHIAATRPPGHAAQPHAHARGADFRPPIA